MYLLYQHLWLSRPNLLVGLDYLCLAHQNCTTKHLQPQHLLAWCQHKHNSLLFHQQQGINNFFGNSWKRYRRRWDCAPVSIEYPRSCLQDLAKCDSKKYPEEILVSHQSGQDRSFPENQKQCTVVSLEFCLNGLIRHRSLLPILDILSVWGEYKYASQQAVVANLHG